MERYRIAECMKVQKGQPIPNLGENIPVPVLNGAYVHPNQRLSMCTRLYSTTSATGWGDGWLVITGHHDLLASHQFHLPPFWISAGNNFVKRSQFSLLSTKI